MAEIFELRPKATPPLITRTRPMPTKNKDDPLEDLRKLRIQISMMRGMLARIDMRLPYTTGITRDLAAASLANAKEAVKHAYETLYPPETGTDHTPRSA